MNANAIRLRSGTLDSLRGLTLFSMIAYHLCWDLVYLRGLPWAWYNGFWAYIWQQSICCTFILLSGYCCQASRHPIRRGAISFFGGAAVSLATALVTPEEPIRFGVLTFLGTAALLTVPLRPLLARIPPRLGLVLSFSLFLLARDVNHGYLALLGCRCCGCPVAGTQISPPPVWVFPPPPLRPQTISPCCRGSFCSGPGSISTDCGRRSPPCRIFACRDCPL